jgi:DNA-directed RNA polymerase specialized sigma24 family protein
VPRSETLTAIPVSGPGDVTQLLSAARDGERPALDALFARVYEELHAIAHHQLAGRDAGGTLSGTVLVHEAYLKLVDGAPVHYRDRRHFFALAAMRQIVLDSARRNRRRVAARDAAPVTRRFPTRSHESSSQATTMGASDPAVAPHAPDPRLLCGDSTRALIRSWCVETKSESWNLCGGRHRGPPWRALWASNGHQEVNQCIAG